MTYAYIIFLRNIYQIKYKICDMINIYKLIKILEKNEKLDKK